MCPSQGRYLPSEGVLVLTGEAGVRQERCRCACCLCSVVPLKRRHNRCHIWSSGWGQLTTEGGEVGGGLMTSINISQSEHGSLHSDHNHVVDGEAEMKVIPEELLCCPLRC